MDRTSYTPKICFAVTALLTLAGVILRTVCMLTVFDNTVGYFDTGILSTLSTVLYFLGALIPMICAALIPKGTLPTTLHTRLRLPVAYLWGLALAAFTVLSLIVCFPTRNNALLTYPTVMGILGSIYFWLSGHRNGRYPDLLSLAGFLPVLWCVAAVAETYTDQFTTMNSPIKISLQLGLIGLMVILISELRFRLGKALPRAAVALLGIGSYLALCGAVPLLVATGARILDNTLHLLYAIVLLCGGLYGLFVLFQFTCMTDAATKDSDTAACPATPESPTAE